MRSAIRLAILAILLTGDGPSRAATPTPTPTRPVRTTYFGETMTDPCRWMETEGPAFKAWAHAQDAITRQALAKSPGYAALAAEVAAASDSGDELSNPTVVGNQIYYERQGHGEAQPSLYVHLLAGGAERRLVDPVAFGDATTSIHEYAVSADNRMLVFALSTGGSQEAVLHLDDIRFPRTCGNPLASKAMAMPRKISSSSRPGIEAS